MTEQARAYKSEVVNAAKGEAARFESLLTEYTKAPEITKERLYIESMESVLSRSSKVMVGTGDSGNNMMYLPIDKLINSGNDSSGTNNSTNRRNNTQQPEFVTPQPTPQAPRTSNNNRLRTRGAN